MTGLPADGAATRSRGRVVRRRLHDGAGTAGAQRPDRTRRGGALGPATRPPAAAGRTRRSAAGAPPPRRAARRGATDGPGGGDGTVPGGDRTDAEREDHELGGAGHSGLAGSRRGRQRQERPPAPHTGDTGAPGPGLVHRPDRVPRGPGPAPGHPLTGCGEWREACRAAAELCEAAKGEGTTADGEFWYATAAKLLAPLFVAAALDRRTMADVVRWVDTQEVGEVSSHFGAGGVARGPARRRGDLVP